MKAVAHRRFFAITDVIGNPQGGVWWRHQVLEDSMKRNVIVPKGTPCGESGITEALKAYSVDEPSYTKMLAARVSAADRGEFASATEVARFFAENSE